MSNSRMTPVTGLKGRDGLYIELLKLRAEMRGISPKTSVYKKLNDKIIEIRAKINGTENAMTTEEWHRLNDKKGDISTRDD